MEPQAKKLRDYLLRGGFFMADDFHGIGGTGVFREDHENGVSRAPDR